MKNHQKLRQETLTQHICCGIIWYNDKWFLSQKIVLGVFEMNCCKKCGPSVRFVFHPEAQRDSSHLNQSERELVQFSNFLFFLKVRLPVTIWWKHEKDSIQVFHLLPLSHLIQPLIILNTQVYHNYCLSTGRIVFLLETLHQWSCCCSTVSTTTCNNIQMTETCIFGSLHHKQQASKDQWHMAAFLLHSLKRCIFSWYVHGHMSAGMLTLSTTWSCIQLQKVDRLIFAFGCCSQNTSKASLKVYIM